MAKYKDIFKSWIFWLVVFVISIIQLAQFQSIYGEVYFSGYLGMLAGSFIFSAICYMPIYFIKKGIGKIPKRK